MSPTGPSRTGLTIGLAIFFGFLAGALGYYVAATVMPVPAPSESSDATRPTASSRPAPSLPTIDLSGADANTGKQIAAAVQRVIPAVVNIDNLGRIRPGMRSPFDELFGPQAPRGGTQPQLRGSGSGFVIDSKRGLVMTNQHVVEQADKLEVTFDSDRTFDAKPVGADKMSDIAILQIDSDDLPEAPLGLAADLLQGEWVIAIGNPFRDFPHTVTVGVVSALNRHMPVGDRQYNNLIQTDAAINMGNSGGPLCNLMGEVIGVNSAIFSPTQTYAGIGFAIVIDDAMRIANHLIENGGVPWLGIGMRDLTPEYAAELGLTATSGVVITEVYEGSPADKSGIRAKDILLAFNGHKVESSDEVPPLVLDTTVDQTVAVLVQRNGKQKKLKLTIGARQNS